MDDVTFGVVLPTGITPGDDPRGLLDLAVRAESLGFTSVFVGDTLLRPIMEPLTLLSAMAVATRQVRLGTAALLPALRRPVHAAQAIATLDQLSGGRVTITVGAGFPNRSEAEYAASEVPWRRRFARLDDTVALWRSLWTADGPISFAGDVLRLDHVPHCATPVQPGGPPVWLGGATPAALERAGRLYDGWLPYPPRLSDYGDGLAHVRATAIRAGRGEGAVTPALFATVLITDDPASGRAALADYTKTTYRLPLETVETIQLLVAGPPAHVRERLMAYVEAGARHVVCRIAAIDRVTQRTQLELVRAALDESA